MLEPDDAARVPDWNSHAPALGLLGAMDAARTVEPARRWTRRRRRGGVLLAPGPGRPPSKPAFDSVQGTGLSRARASSRAQSRAEWRARADARLALASPHWYHNVMRLPWHSLLRPIVAAVRRRAELHGAGLRLKLVAIVWPTVRLRLAMMRGRHWLRRRRGAERRRPLSSRSSRHVLAPDLYHCLFQMRHYLVLSI